MATQVHTNLISVWPVQAVWPPLVTTAYYVISTGDHPMMCDLYWWLPHTMWSLLVTTPWCVISTGDHPILCDLYWWPPHVVWSLLVTTPYYVIFTGDHPMLCDLYWWPSHTMWSLLVTTPCCVISMIKTCSLIIMTFKGCGSYVCMDLCIAKVYGGCKLCGSWNF